MSPASNWYAMKYTQDSEKRRHRVLKMKNKFHKRRMQQLRHMVRQGVIRRRLGHARESHPKTQFDTIATAVGIFARFGVADETETHTGLSDTIWPGKALATG
jgi:hypothetical protein